MFRSQKDKCYSSVKYKRNYQLLAVVLLGDQAKVLEHPNLHHLIQGYGHLQTNTKVSINACNPKYSSRMSVIWILPVCEFWAPNLLGFHMCIKIKYSGNPKTGHVKFLNGQLLVICLMVSSFQIVTQPRPFYINKLYIFMLTLEIPVQMFSTL